MMKWKERKRRHDDEHRPLTGRGARANKPKSAQEAPAAMLVVTNADAPLWEHGCNCFCPICMPAGTSQAH